MNLHKYLRRPGIQANRLSILLIISLVGFLLSQSTNSVVKAKPLSEASPQIVIAQTALTYGVQWGSHNTPTSLAMNQQVDVSVTLKNVGSTTWLKGGNNPVNLSYHWFKGNQVAVWDGLKTALPQDVAPGQSVTLSASLKAPAEAGEYTLKWDLVQDGVTWFSFNSAATQNVAVSVLSGM